MWANFPFLKDVDTGNADAHEEKGVGISNPFTNKPSVFTEISCAGRRKRPLSQGNSGLAGDLRLIHREQSQDRGEPRASFCHRLLRLSCCVLLGTRVVRG